jgi:hypothetical protein
MIKKYTYTFRCFILRNLNLNLCVYILEPFELNITDKARVRVRVRGGWVRVSHPSPSHPHPEFMNVACKI